MVTPDDIENRVFSLVRRGYDPTEVDDFLKEVAAELSRAQGGLATPPPPPPPPPELADDEVDGVGADDFSRLGDEVAEILRQAHRSVAELRHRAEADAALIRQQAQEEAEQLRAEADRDRQAAGVELESARAKAAETLAGIEAQSAAATARAEAAARAKVQEVIEQAKVDARGAVLTQRNVRGRLEGVRTDVDSALDRLTVEDEALFPTIDLTDETLAATGGAVVEAEPEVPPPGQGPPTPAVPPPPRSPYDDLPYDTADDEEVIDLVEPSSAEEGPDDETPADGADPLPVPPPPPPPLGDEGGAAAEVPDAPTGDDEDEDGLAQMVKDAVENALRRRKGDTDPSNGTGS
jgi:DivIVA domain-containing protein